MEMLILQRKRAIAKTPTPIKNARDAPECLPVKPCIILAIPLIRNAIPMNMIIVIAVATGKDIAMPAKIRTSMAAKKQHLSKSTGKARRSQQMFGFVTRAKGKNELWFKSIGEY
jgi:hypothetical protein